MKRNVGTVDRIVRVIAGIAMLLVGFLVIEGVAGVVVGAIGAVVLLTGVIGSCLLYVPFKIDTNKAK
jgi:hypothetical protein